MAKVTTISEYIKNLPAQQTEVAEYLDTLILGLHNQIKGSIKWAQPVYEFEGPMIFMKSAKNHLTFGFWRGKELTDVRGLLEGEGDRMAHIKLSSMADVNEVQLVKWIKEAVVLNKKYGDPTKRAK